jgi:hypothetical protein
MSGCLGACDTRHRGCAFNSRPAAAATRSMIRAKPAVVNGDPRSLTKTNGDVSLSAGAAAGPGVRHRAMDGCWVCRS